MAAQTTFSYHVAGPILVQYSVTGTGGTYYTVGECRDGADLVFRPFTRDIKHDGAGGPEGDAAEIIFLNFAVEVRCQVVPYAGLYMNYLRSLAQATGHGATDGVMAKPGTLYGGNSRLPVIQFQVDAGGELDGGWRFHTCQVVRCGDMSIGVKESAPELGFRCINYKAPDAYRTANSILSNVLYSRI